jgi:hypothetical protein
MAFKEGARSTSDLLISLILLKLFKLVEASLTYTSHISLTPAKPEE